MADAVDRADDRITALDHAVDAHERVLLAAVVMHQLGPHAGGDAAQVVDRTAAATDIQDAARDGRLDGLVTGVGAGAGGGAARDAHALLPALTLELLLKITDHALGSARTLAGNRQGALPSGGRLIAATLAGSRRRGHERNGDGRAFAQSRQRGVTFENDLAVAFGLAQQLRLEIVKARLKLARAARVLVRHATEHMAQHVDIAEDARAE